MHEVVCACRSSPACGKTSLWRKSPSVLSGVLSLVCMWPTQIIKRKNDINLVVCMGEGGVRWGRVAGHRGAGGLVGVVWGSFPVSLSPFSDLRKTLSYLCIYETVAFPCGLPAGQLLVYTSSAPRACLRHLLDAPLLFPLCAFPFISFPLFRSLFFLSSSFLVPFPSRLVSLRPCCSRIPLLSFLPPRTIRRCRHRPFPLSFFCSLHLLPSTVLRVFSAAFAVCPVFASSALCVVCRLLAAGAGCRSGTTSEL